ncbi:MAG: 50S ribosomal protein L25/general stress protein Ctc [Pseudomonadota bacterium]
MSDTLELQATARARVGKGASRQARRDGMVPAIIYGNKKDPQPIQLERRILVKQLGTGQFLNTIYMLDVDGSKTRVIPRGVETHPVKDHPIHVDFLRVSASTEVTVEIPVSFINEEASPGIKRGGVLNVVRYAVEVNCPADAIPEELVADLTGFDVGDALHISAISLPENVVPTITDRDFTVATIAAPAGLRSEEGEEGGDEAAEAETAEE